MPGISAGRGRRRRMADAVALAVVLLVAGLAFFAHFSSSPRRASGDTYYYLSQALEIAGVPADQARLRAGEVVCSELHRAHERHSSAPDCTRYEVNPPQRYAEIFTSRPGWPLLIAPFVGLLGPWTGAVTGTVLIALLAAGLVFAALRQVVDPVAAAAGGITFSLLGTGTWAAWLLPEGAVFACVALALLGATRWLQGSRGGAPLVAGALVLAYACKPANGAALSVALLAAGLVLALLPPGGHRELLLAAAGGLGVVGWMVVSWLLDLPSLQDTLQDLATRHFAVPDVADPYLRLKNMNELLWTGQVERWLGVPQPLLLIVAACVVAVVTLRRAGVLWALVALSAVGIVALHPLVSQYDRLIAPAWFAVCAAVAGLVGLFGRRVFAAWDFSTGARPRDGDDRRQRTVGVGAPQEEP